MAVTDGVSVTETPWLKRGSMWYASAPFNSPILGYCGFTLVLGVGTTLSACGAETSTLWQASALKQEAPLGRGSSHLNQQVKFLFQHQPQHHLHLQHPPIYLLRTNLTPSPP